MGLNERSFCAREAEKQLIQTEISKFFMDCFQNWYRHCFYLAMSMIGTIKLKEHKTNISFTAKKSTL